MDIYYVSDIHLEQQIGVSEKNAQEIENDLRRKIVEMVGGIQSENAILLIAGDISDNCILTSFFMYLLKQHWKGKVFFVLGNHELQNMSNKDSEQNVDAMIQQYIIQQYKRHNEELLENSLVIQLKNGKNIILNEETVMSLDNQYICKICKDNIVILGGTGFSRHNDYFTDQNGLYVNNLTLEESIKRADRFADLHGKLANAIGNKRCIVLTHTPAECWMRGKEYVSNWIYINGHTHKNYQGIISGALVLSNNQFGYSPQKWSLRCVKIL